LCAAAVAGFAYCWRVGSAIEIFYAASVRSMSASWHDFFYAAFDPAGTVSIDKLPGALWIQALAVRLLGVHPWVIDLPQAIEGILTVLVLYRAVRRLAGPGPAVAAAWVLAISPATVTLDRGNISDTLLVLLLVLAANSVVSALVKGRFRHVVFAGIWVGLAFQAKMIEAWLVVPALAVAYLVASRSSVRSKILAVVAMGISVVVVSLSWMTLVSLTPASQRPYVDGSQSDSVFEQVFDYNGFGRVGQLTPNQELGQTLGIGFLTAAPPGPAWNRLLTRAYGRDTGWLLPLALLIAVLGLIFTRRRIGSDLVFGGILLWGTWLVILAVVFSSTAINSYYLGALSPAIAALVGIGAKLAWERRQESTTRWIVLAAVLLSACYGWWLIPSAGTGVQEWFRPALLGVAVAAAVYCLLAMSNIGLRGAFTTSIVLSTVTLIFVPLVASVSVVTNDLGAFDTPFQPVETTTFLNAFFGAPLDIGSTLPEIESVRHGAPDLMATQTSVLAAPYIFSTGDEVLPIGGYTGTIPEPTLTALESMVATGQFELVLAGPSTSDPRVAWIAAHCIDLPQPKPVANRVTPILRAYYCERSS
jgi:4-amino-4-deoxy-L-arabinose transferase-like glycosyltransferase